MLTSRATIVDAICNHLRANVTELKLVKPYNGELDRYSKRLQIKEETFPAIVNITTPFALVITKDRQRLPGQGASTKFRHDISVYVGEANNHDFNSLDVPPILALLDKVVNALHGAVLMRGAGALTLESDGEYLITTDLFTIYDQKYYQLEIGS